MSSSSSSSSSKRGPEDIENAKAAPPSSTSFYAQAHAASASRAEAAEARVSAEASLISARLLSKEGDWQKQGKRQLPPPRCWPRPLLRAIDAEARRRGRRCVMWDDGGDGSGSGEERSDASPSSSSPSSSSPSSSSSSGPFCCWIRWDWERGVPLEMAAAAKGSSRNGGGGGGGGGGGDASWWEVLARSLGPPLVPSEGLEASVVGAWLDRHTIKVHGPWGEAEGDSEGGEREGGEQELPLGAAVAER